MSTKPETLVGGRYRVERQIGSGATARVWLAFDQVLERRVAVKMLAAPIGGESAHIERFRREARAVAQLQHPHIVTVLDTGEHDAMPYIVLEYVDGETLKARIQRVGRLTITEAVAFVVEIARALDAAHARGLVHRDVKPQNILLDAEGGAKITDFGIARSGNEDGLTVDGRVLGTTDYVSPEQALGHQVTGQSDVYSLGVVLYEALTGSVPFSAPSHIAVATMHVRDEIPDVQQRRPEVSAALAAVVERATAKHLARRYASAREMIADLEEVLAIETARVGDAGKEATIVLRSLPEQATRRLPARVRHPLSLLALAVVAVAVVGAVVWFLATSTHRGVAPPQGLAGSNHERAVRPAQGAAVPYNPFGTDARGPLDRGAGDRRRRLDVLADRVLRRRRARQVRRRPLHQRGARRGRQRGQRGHPHARLPLPGLGHRLRARGRLRLERSARHHAGAPSAGPCSAAASPPRRRCTSR